MEEERFLPTVGYESAYEITASGKAVVRSTSTGRTLKINPAGWVVLRDPKTRRPVHVQALSLRPRTSSSSSSSDAEEEEEDAAMEEATTKKKTRRSSWRWWLVMSVVVILAAVVASSNRDIDDISKEVRTHAIACLRSVITYLLDRLERLERLEGDARAAVAAYSWRHLYGGTRPVYHWADDLSSDRSWVQNYSR
jgi:hypothetical protein